MANAWRGEFSFEINKLFEYNSFRFFWVKIWEFHQNMKIYLWCVLKLMDCTFEVIYQTMKMKMEHGHSLNFHSLKINNRMLFHWIFGRIIDIWNEQNKNIRFWRLCSTKINYADLIGFNNTGNTCKDQRWIYQGDFMDISGIWPSEEVLAYYCLKEKEIFE